MTALATILVALLVSVIAPTLLAVMTNKQNRLNKAQDWAREDVVAKQAAAAAALLLDRQEAIATAAKEASSRAEASAAQLIEVNTRVGQENALATSALAGKVEIVHRLVNSNMTAAMQSELDAKKAQRVALQVVVGYKKASGENHSDEDKEIIALAAKITDLEAKLVERQIQQEKADAQQVALTEAAAGGVMGAALNQQAVAEAAIKHETAPLPPPKEG